MQIIRNNTAIVASFGQAGGASGRGIATPAKKTRTVGQ